MAEISETNRSKRGVAKSKKLSTRVDLTPMVDLGFLLITFFIFTTAIAKPNAVNLNMPAEGGDTKTSADKTLSLILDKNNEIYYYHGLLPANLHKTNYNAAGLRHLIDSTMNAVKQKFGNRTETVVLVKPTSNSTYQNVVDALDEITINGVTKYVLMDADEKETALIK